MRGACVPPSASSSTRGVAGCSQKGRRALLGGAGRGLQPPCPPPQGQRPGRRVPGASRGCQPFPSSELMLLLLLPPGRGLEGSRSQRFSSSHLPGVALPRTLLRVWEQRGAAAAAGCAPGVHGAGGGRCHAQVPPVRSFSFPCAWSSFLTPLPVYLWGFHLFFFFCLLLSCPALLLVPLRLVHRVRREPGARGRLLGYPGGAGDVRQHLCRGRRAPGCVSGLCHRVPTSDKEHITDRALPFEVPSLARLSS